MRKQQASITSTLLTKQPFPSLTALLIFGALILLVPLKYNTASAAPVFTSEAECGTPAGDANTGQSDAAYSACQSFTIPGAIAYNDVTAYALAAANVGKTGGISLAYDEAISCGESPPTGCGQSLAESHASYYEVLTINGGITSNAGFSLTASFASAATNGGTIIAQANGVTCPFVSVGGGCTETVTFNDPSVSLYEAASSGFATNLATGSSGGYSLGTVELWLASQPKLIDLQTGAAVSYTTSGGEVLGLDGQPPPVSLVPIPSSGWLMLTGLLSFGVAIKRKHVAVAACI